MNNQTFCFTERESMIAQLLSDGLTNHEIGNKLYISTSTVKSTLEKMYRKLNVSNRTQLVSLAQKLGLIWHYFISLQKHSESG